MEPPATIQKKEHMSIRVGATITIIGISTGSPWVKNVSLQTTHTYDQTAVMSIIVKI